MLHPALYSTGQKQMQMQKRIQQKSNEDDNKSGAHLLWKEAKRTGNVRPKEEKAHGDFISAHI